MLGIRKNLTFGILKRLCGRQKINSVLININPFFFDIPNKACCSFEHILIYHNICIIVNIVICIVKPQTIINLDDGSIFTVYYQINKPGERTCLMSTRWTPPALK